jgi:hypothetical protein
MPVAIAVPAIGPGLRGRQAAIGPLTLCAATSAMLSCSRTMRGQVCSRTAMKDGVLLDLIVCLSKLCRDDGAWAFCAAWPYARASVTGGTCTCAFCSRRTCGRDSVRAGSLPAHLVGAGPFGASASGGQMLRHSPQSAPEHLAQLVPEHLVWAARARPVVARPPKPGIA